MTTDSGVYLRFYTFMAIGAALFARLVVSLWLHYVPDTPDPRSQHIAFVGSFNKGDVMIVENGEVDAQLSIVYNIDGKQSYRRSQLTPYQKVTIPQEYNSRAIVRVVLKPASKYAKVTVWPKLHKVVAPSKTKMKETFGGNRWGN